jgi:hypothetical protein
VAHEASPEETAVQAHESTNITISQSEESKLSCSPRKCRKKSLKQIKKFFFSSSPVVVAGEKASEEGKTCRLVEVAKVMLRTWETWIFDF